ncbi:hypothetical protein I5L39_21720, partial [Pseudomonas aeruginosa]|nr:hypothetical protein [Pseudomonas aeruginosa]
PGPERRLQAFAERQRRRRRRPRRRRRGGPVPGGGGGGGGGPAGVAGGAGAIEAESASFAIDKIDQSIAKYSETLASRGGKDTQS